METDYKNILKPPEKTAIKARKNKFKPQLD
jgi:hypothetical protein